MGQCGSFSISTRTFASVRADGRAHLALGVGRQGAVAQVLYHGAQLRHSPPHAPGVTVSPSAPASVGSASGTTVPGTAESNIVNEIIRQ